MSAWTDVGAPPGTDPQERHFELAEGALLGNKTGTDAGRASRGFQGIGVSLGLVQEIDPETGEIITYQDTAKGRRVYRTPQELRAERYALKAVVNRMFPNSRTAKCCRVRVPNRLVEVCKDHEHNKAFYTGTIRCGSPWRCPVDAATIAERRRAELVAAVATAKAMGWQVCLMTCTVPHGLGDDIHGMLDQMMKAWRSMTINRAGQQIRKLLGIEGTIRTLETTDGANGFHPHFHVLIFSSGKFTPSSFQAGFLPLWQDACVKAGLPRPSDRRGLQVDDGSWAEKYATKWGLEDEMVKGHMKTSKDEKGMTPWDMLRDILKTGSKRSEARFRIYAAAFEGRRQLYWSNGLKAKLGVAEVSDEELIAQHEEHASVLSELTVDEWKAVLATRSEAALLDVAERNPQDIKPFLKALQSLQETKKL